LVHACLRPDDRAGPPTAHTIRLTPEPTARRTPMPTSTLTNSPTASPTGEPTTLPSRAPPIPPSRPENDADALPVSFSRSLTLHRTIALSHSLSHHPPITTPHSLSYFQPVHLTFSLSHSPSTIPLTFGWQWSCQRSTVLTAVRMSSARIMISRWVGPVTAGSADRAAAAVSLSHPLPLSLRSLCHITVVVD
jgi:hypothetical protein